MKTNQPQSDEPHALWKADARRWTSAERETTATCAAARSPHLAPPPCTASPARIAVHTHTAVGRVRTPNCKSGHTSVRP